MVDTIQSLVKSFRGMFSNSDRTTHTIRTESADLDEIDTAEATEDPNTATPVANLSTNVVAGEPPGHVSLTSHVTLHTYQLVDITSENDSHTDTDVDSKTDTVSIVFTATQQTDTHEQTHTINRKKN